MARPTQATLNLKALHNNVAHARALAPGSRLMAVVKANAYGHGAVTIARELQDTTDAFAVASMEEALELRAAQITTPVLLLEGVFDPTEIEEAARQQLWLTIGTQRQLAWLEDARPDRPLSCWLKVNTGMNRLGVNADKAQSYYERLLNCANVVEQPVLYTHFSSADNLRSSCTRDQLGRFNAISIQAPRSAANSAGVLAWPQSHFDWVRPGYMLYGNSPFENLHPNAAVLQPVMTLRSSVISIREVGPGEAVGYGGTFVTGRPSRIATIAVGYGDGYPRQARNGTPVLINGQRAALAGRVSMDMMTADVTDIGDVGPGSPVTLWGDGLSVDEVARHAGTLGYELTTRMPARTPRVASAS